MTIAREKISKIKTAIDELNLIKDGKYVHTVSNLLMLLKGVIQLDRGKNGLKKADVDTVIKRALKFLSKYRKETQTQRTAKLNKKYGHLFREELIILRLCSTLIEKSPTGFKGTVKAMKKKKEIINPYALAQYMQKKSYKSHYKKDGTPKE